jgi:7-keto-8-aminopelargonate synthetase-like enzyme
MTINGVGTPMAPPPARLTPIVEAAPADEVVAPPAAPVRRPPTPTEVRADPDEGARDKLLRLIEELGDDRVEDLLRFGSSLKWQFRSLADGLTRQGFRVAFTEGMSCAPEVAMDGRHLVNFTPYNVLNLQSRPDVMNCFTTAARRFGLAAGGSRFGTGITRAHTELENEFCRILGKERAVSYASGADAAQSFVHAMTTRQSWPSDLTLDHTEVVLVLDRDVHRGWWKAAEALDYGSRLFSFRHNDAEHLASVLEGLRGKRIVVVLESVYAGDGSVAPMSDLIEVCERHDALSCVDDSAGFLVYGPKHRPFSAEYAGLPRASFVLASLDRTLGLTGCVVAGPGEAITALEALDPSPMFGGQLSPTTAATATYSIRLLTSTEPTVVDRYLDRVRGFRSKLTVLGLRINETPSLVTSVDVGRESSAVALRDALFDRGYRAPIDVFPSAARKHATLRLTMNAAHSDEHLLGMIAVLQELRPKLDF